MELYVMDAFSTRIFGGNQAGVALPDRPLSDDTMRRIAAELKHSETAFVTPEPDGSVSLRYFTPAGEVELCGHATIATAKVLYHTKLMQTEWKRKEALSVELKGLNLDSVWENIIMQIGGITIDQGNTLDEQIAADEHRQKIEKEIAKLEKQARAEKQPKKKFELVQQIKKLKDELR